MTREGGRVVKKRRFNMENVEDLAIWSCVVDEMVGRVLNGEEKRAGHVEMI